MSPNPADYRADAEFSLGEFMAMWTSSDNVCSVGYLNRIQSRPAGRAGRVGVPIGQRFWQKARQDDRGCWIWTSTTLRGYGQIALSRNGAQRQRRVWAHRVAWELFHDRPVPDGLIIRHKCDVSRCVNPWHLEVGTPLDNVRDQKARHRLTFGRAPLPASGLQQQIVQDAAAQAQQESGRFDQRGRAFDFDAQDAIAYLGLPSPYALYRRIKRHGLPARRVGGNWRFNRAQLDAWREGVTSRVRSESDSVDSAAAMSL